MNSAQSLAEAPEVLVVPTMSDVPRDDDGTPRLEGTVDVMLVPLEAESGGTQLVALAFSTVVGLVEAMGEEQPWVAIPADKLEEVLEGSGAQAVLLDPQPA
ncbi:SAV_915 family protein [Streptomyces sp. NPDC006967]|uniref:SAV_915 family protein n=1 Tax=Streptomyces TaxID=1883 RepID=UPI000CD4DE47|nr:SAV_915 family protein [Streptomyces sp. SM1]